MGIRTLKRKVAPFLDILDVIFGIVLLGIIGAGLDGYIEYSGVLALITASTAFVAVYRLRHRQEKERPSVREDFEEREDKKSDDFGLRNYGPGPALYLQAVATVEKGEQVDTVQCFAPHDRPIHLTEGEFVGLVHELKDDWLGNMVDKYEPKPATGDNGDTAMVNLYYSFISQASAREPITASAEREDEVILSEIKDPDSDARHIELWRLREDCQANP